MKLRAFLFVLVLFGMGACTQRTCPTYTKQDVPQQEMNVDAEQAARV